MTLVIPRTPAIAAAIIGLLVFTACGSSGSHTPSPVPATTGAGGVSSTSPAHAATSSAVNAVPTMAEQSTNPPPSAQSATTTMAAAGSAGSVDPCTLLTSDEVSKLASDVGKGSTKTIAGVTRICDWSNSNGIPMVQLIVTPAGSTPLKDDLSSQLGGTGGYTVVAVSGIGDEAAAAFQKADPSKGLQAGLAILSARKGSEVVSLSTPMLTITQGSAAFGVAKNLVTTAISRLGSGG